MSDQGTVYWVREKSGRVLYVGMTTNFEARARTHKKNFGKGVEVCPRYTASRDIAYFIEQAEIRRHHPPSNADRAIGGWKHALAGPFLNSEIKAIMALTKRAGGIGLQGVIAMLASQCLHDRGLLPTEPRRSGKPSIRLRTLKKLGFRRTLAR